MNSIVEYFATLENRPLHRVAFLAGSILVLWIIEGGVPLLALRYRKNKMKHALVNFSFTFFHLIIHATLAVYLIMICDWCNAHQFGLVHWLHFPVWAVIIFGILSMDFFGGWLVHIVQHKVPILWRMHMVHHIDTNIDVTTGLRHHPLEAFFRWVFFFAGILITGLPIYAVMIAQTLMSIFTTFTHANIRLPLWLDKGMSYLLVSPNMHKVHHHYKQPFTDSNYGNAFSIWDHLFGTYKSLDPDQIKYGLDKYYNMEKDEDFTALLKSPFGKLEINAASKETEKIEVLLQKDESASL
jgi:sterol desaturase/sphingolipid hydroxylase (fatty acid hydroxylase superfamily)